MTEKKKVSILISAYNEEKYIKECINSCLTQTYNNIEILIYNDGSSDNTMGILNSYGDKLITINNNKNTGKIIGFNSLFEIATGDYFIFLGADDVIDKNYILDLIEYNQNCILHFIDVYNDSLTVKKKVLKTTDYLTNSKFNQLSRLLSVPVTAWFFSKEIANLIFPIPVQIPYEDIWVSTIIKHHDITITESHLSGYKYRQHDKNTFRKVNDRSFETRKYRLNRNCFFINYMVIDNPLKLSDQMLDALYELKHLYASILECKKSIEVVFKNIPFQIKFTIIISDFLSVITNWILKRKLS